MISEKARIISNEKLAEGVFSTVFESRISEIAVPGQFVMVGTGSDSRLLRRPISICEADRDKGTVRLVYRIAGYGTEELSGASAGDGFDMLGPVGNGFSLEKAQDKKDILLVGGGIGAPPLLSLARALRRTGIGKDGITAVLGYRSMNAGLFLNEEFGKEVKVLLSTDDGSVGIRGTVMDAIRERDLRPDIIYACGPMVMLKAIKEFAADNFIPAYISLEERMACGMGVCLGCMVRTREKDAHSQVNNARVCTEGPVFEAMEVEI
ncbi:MAG: dihydroorotate dehydrogenase electron transfer subunit [Lachnospiraceae bacterium]|nr:dihydroorotate dehydrogenase electron transfer subunit [Lachnospiraceae bacterium]